MSVQCTCQTNMPCGLHPIHKDEHDSFGTRRGVVYEPSTPKAIQMTTDQELLARIDFEITRWLRIEKDAGQVMSDGTHDSSISSSWKALRAVVEIKTYAEQGVPLSTMDFEMELQDKVILKVRQAIEEAMK